ncbi:hypothetical protein J2S19_002925 [Metabacillus malikii]|uniref:Uncharacterized protein n=1 Tax=Metabacillus malikii TaxID=1504265 RepID=A0ABT9ZH71_9BACI|nr:hypothetical protein [Metabacillus malikii]
MYITLILPIITPYGHPVTALNPMLHQTREQEFFQWINTISSNRYSSHVQLLLTEDMEKHETTIVQGKPQSQTNFVPSGS